MLPEYKEDQSRKHKKLSRISFLYSKRTSLRKVVSTLTTPVHTPPLTVSEIYNILVDPPMESYRIFRRLTYCDLTKTELELKGRAVFTMAIFVFLQISSEM